MLLGAAAAILVGVFAWGTVWNVRRGNAIVRLLQPGLKALGERSTLRWLGSTAVELVLRDAKAPFRSVTVVVFLKPRDLPWLWAGRRRDTVIVRGELRRAAHDELEALDVQRWSGRDALRRAESLPVHEGDVWCSSSRAVTHAVELRDRAAGAGLHVQRLSLRGPMLQLHVDAPQGAASAAALLEVVRDLGERS